MDLYLRAADEAAMNAELLAAGLITTQVISVQTGEDEDGRPMNEFKAVAWRRWLLFLGLGVPLPLVSAPDFPSPAARILRERHFARRAEART